MTDKPRYVRRMELKQEEPFDTTAQYTTDGKDAWWIQEQSNGFVVLEGTTKFIKVTVEEFKSKYRKQEDW